MRGTGRPVVAVLAPMASELRPVARAGRLRAASAVAGRHAYDGRIGGADVFAVRIGIGTEAATNATAQILDDRPADHVVVVGIAGGVGAAHGLGDLIAPALVVDAASGLGFRPHPLGATDRQPAGSLFTGDELIRDRARLAQLDAEGVIGLDMESASVAAVCEARGIPWSVERAISDLAEDNVIEDAVGSLARADGRPDGPAVARYLLRGPWRARHLARLGRQMQVAARVAAVSAVAGIGRLAP